MTEYWVSQGNKWCEHCHIFIANNAASIRMHEYGQRHKDNVTRRLAAIRKGAIAEDAQKKQAERDMRQIEAAAQRQYDKDRQAAEQHQQAQAAAFFDATVEPMQTAEYSRAEPSGGPSSEEWVQAEGSGYYYNAATGYYYDPDSGLYYTSILGRWTTQAEAMQASSQHSAAAAATSKHAAAGGHASGASASKMLIDSASTSNMGFSQTSAAPGPVKKEPAVPGRLGRGVASAVAVTASGSKRKDRGGGPLSAEEAAAREAREAARRRTEEREMRNLGLYQSF